MKISVVITVYNLEKYIDDAIQSVLHQTRKPDEILVVDDFSIDNSFKIINKYSDKLKYIRQKENIGALKNTLSGLKESSGDIVAFLDGDDVWMPEKLEFIEKEFLQDEDIIIVSHDFIRVDENLHNLNILDETNLNTTNIINKYSKENWSEKFKDSILLRKGFWLGSAYAVKKKAILLETFEELVSQHPQAHLSYLDMTLPPFMIASKPDGKVSFVNKCLFKYRVHGSNSWKSTNLDRAVNNINRWKAVHSSTFYIISRFLSDKKIKRRYDSLNEELELLRLQYTGKKVKAVIKFLSLSNSLIKEGRWIHECKRLLITTLVGAKNFYKIKQRK